ncbi:hypothetical protein EV191_11415 [Tamaricihabitans halophyticus]|uniref:ATP-grasp domain-containing protein n=1 Tax=Tamaricihabitans halophyticus TaxID=1262583 RepID=A0A4R2QDB9_9PSEU|nr:hypothetical protein [Tamaricihabitans halophyticus]TCP46218.1 hypothetical protein EV191_11415 [Tamaricihabitans halophyticus]
MSDRVLLVGCAALPEGDGDDQTVAVALRALGLRAEWAVWSDPAGDFGKADLVVLRASWDYAQRRDEFLRWCAAVPRLANSAAVARWNTDKAYLVELAERGVPTVPTELVRPVEAVDPAFANWPDVEFVIKPAVGAGARGAARFPAGATDAAARHLAAVHRTGVAALVQPYQSDVDASGEVALVFFRGVYSHAFSKAAILPARSEGSGAALDASGTFGTEKLGPVEPEPAYRALAEDALDATAELLEIDRAELLYARVDVLRGTDGRPLLLELELTEPSLGFQTADPGAPLRFASAIRAALR